MATNKFGSDTWSMGKPKLSVEVEGDHVYLVSECCGCGDEMTNLETIQALRDELTALLVREWGSPDG